MTDLRKKPYCLSEEDIDWVNGTIKGMSNDEKIGQLFTLITYDNDLDHLKHLCKDIQPGGMMCRPMPMEEVLSTIQTVQTNSKIPMLIAANLESGGVGIVYEGTKIGSPMQVAATDDIQMAYKLGVVCGREASSLGANWAFAPIIDIDYNFRNPITNTRTFGSDPDRVMAMGLEYLRGVQENGLAASIKHFPGDGRDERDQHLVTSVNDMTCEQWDETYGKIYKACIDAGTMTVMAGHITHPAYIRKYNQDINDSDMLPATLSYELVTKLLKEQLGFNGLVVTDAATMAGILIPLPREQAVPQTIAAGCDMFLFTRNLEEDLGYMKKGLKDGIITRERLNDALQRILGLKAALKLHHKQQEGTLVPNIQNSKKIINNEEHQHWAKECADKSITLVKEEKGVLPISPNSYKKVLFYEIESSEGFAYSVRVGAVEKFRKLLEKEGFDIDIYKPSKGSEGLLTAIRDVTEKYDLIIYLANMATKSNQTTVRIEWAQPMGANVPIFTSVVPTIFISVENPYHLLDVPRVRTYINTYNSSDIVLEALVDKLVGRSEFKGKSPVDPFCGKWDTRL